MLVRVMNAWRGNARGWGGGVGGLEAGGCGGGGQRRWPARAMQLQRGRTWVAPSENSVSAVAAAATPKTAHSFCRKSAKYVTTARDGW